MKLHLECSNEEVRKIFNVHHISKLFGQQGFKPKLGGSEFTCYVQECNESCNQDGWRYTVDVEGYDKKEEDIRKAKALVNKTKEDHKEAQRILSALTEGKL